MSLLMRQINMISRSEASYRTKNSSENLPGIYHSYVLAICKHEGRSQEKLAQYLCISKSNVTRHLTYLEKNGYIERRSSEKDKRELLVFPTEKMLGILPEITAITREWSSLLTDGIDESELAAFLATLEKLSDRSKEIIYGKEPDNENGH